MWELTQGRCHRTIHELSLDDEIAGPCGDLVEATALARLQHPNIVQIFGTGTHEGRSFIVEEFVGGGSLDRKLAQRPEAARPAADLVATLGPTVDIYTLGAILYEMLTGRPPFLAASHIETLELVRTADPVPTRQLQLGLPRDVETICLRCLSKDPSRRYATSVALAEDLDRFLDGRPIMARPVSAASCSSTP
jgi:serine/threonine protein kinase